MSKIRISVIPNLEKENSIHYTIKVIKKLQELGAVVLLQCQYKGFLNIDNIEFIENFAHLILSGDIVLTIGGDGTIIHAAKHAALADKPILGINLGRLGFVAELEKDELDMLEGLFDKPLKIEKRSMIEATLNRSNGDVQKFYALNDVVVSRQPLSGIIDINVILNQQEICKYRADGVILATPTGSTAYSLSAGGPLIDPVMKAITLTPICPHAAFSRPVVFSDQSILCVYVGQRKDDVAVLTIDGENVEYLKKEDFINIRVSREEVALIILKNQNFYHVFSDKILGRLSI